MTYIFRTVNFHNERHKRWNWRYKEEEKTGKDYLELGNGKLFGVIRRHPLFLFLLNEIKLLKHLFFVF